MRWLLVLLCGCHFGWSTWQGAPPRAQNAVKLALHTGDEHSKTLAQQVLARDPHVTVIEFDPSVNEQQRIDCGMADCPLALEPACKWARDHGADYYALSTSSARYDATYKCTKYESGSIFDKKDPPCAEGHYTNQHTVATFAINLYDAKTCKHVPALSTKISTRVEGEEDQSKGAAIAQLDAEAPAKTQPLPDQINVGEAGTVDVQDGYYALYRAQQYSGFVHAEAGKLRSLHCCITPSPGDQLVARGKRKLLELAVNGVAGLLSYDGERRLAAGIGSHIRYYPLDSGFRFGFGVDLIGSPAVDTSVFLFTPEIGWGFRPSSAVSLSANVGVGLARGTHAHERLNPTEPAVATAYASHVLANARVITFFAKWWYVGADVGFVYTGMLENWEGDGVLDARPTSVRSPLARLWLGVDL